MAKRTDPHRPGAIIPAEYEHVLSYNGSSTADGWPIPSYGINCELDKQRWYDTEGNCVPMGDKKAVKCVNGEHSPDGRCCVVGLRNIAKVKMVGDTQRCTTCGTFFVYGEIWRHKPTGDHIHLGHICSEKYGLLVDRSAFELAAGRVAAAVAAKLQAEANQEKRAAFFEANPGLEDALAQDHYILRDMQSRFKRNCYLSEKQIALALKISDEVKNPRPTEKMVQAPISNSRTLIQGEIVSIKSYENDFGTSLKMTVKIKTEDGSWLAWGTFPKPLWSANKGDEVEFMAQLKAGRDKHFAIFSRPTKAKILKEAL